MYEKLATYYDLFIDESLIKEYVKLIQSFKKEGTVLDLGTGTAPLAIELAKKNYHVTATDISPEMLEMGYNNAILEDVKVHFFIHDILDTVNRDYDIITMCSDVINYIIDEADVNRVFHNVSLAMNSESIFVFDSITHKYIQKLQGHQEDVLLKDEVMRWRAEHTNVLHQVKHTVKIGHHQETHLQQAYDVKQLTTLLRQNQLSIIKKVKFEERILYVCKKEV